jgi:predicted SAM-dependent methyltransferase
LLFQSRSKTDKDDPVVTLKSKIGAVLIPHELRALRTRIRNLLSPTYHREVRILRTRRDLSVNIGSGGKGKNDWINIELIPMRDTTLCLDIRRRLPLSDNSVCRIIAEHILEHIDFRSDVPNVFRDWHRVLQPGGVVRIIVPDGRRFLEAYVSGEAKKWSDLGWPLQGMPVDIYTPMHIVNHIFHQGGEHLFAYDLETLDWALRRAGFSSVEKMSYRVSRDPLLAIDQENHAPYSLYVEAVK